LYNIFQGQAGHIEFVSSRVTICDIVVAPSVSEIAQTELVRSLHRPCCQLAYIIYSLAASLFTFATDVEIAFIAFPTRCAGNHKDYIPPASVSMTPPAAIDLAALAANCTLVAQNGDDYRVHQAVVEQYPGFAELISTDDIANDLGRRNGGIRVKINVASDVLKLVVLWMYGVSWKEHEQDVRSGNVSGLVQFMRVADAAEKVIDISRW